MKWAVSPEWMISKYFDQVLRFFVTVWYFTHCGFGAWGVQVRYSLRPWHSSWVFVETYSDLAVVGPGFSFLKKMGSPRRVCD